MAKKAGVGRPKKWTEARINQAAVHICSELVKGRSLKRICTEDAEMPDVSTVFDWLAIRPDFANRYAYAREAQADYHVDGMTDISDDKSIDAADKRVMIDTRKWIAAKMRPKKYGDRTDVAVSGTLSLETLVMGSLAPPAESEPE